MFSVRDKLLALATASVGAGLVSLVACSTFDAAGATTDGGEPPDAGPATDAAAEASACPSPSPFCDGGVEITCPNVTDRCFFFCPETTTHPLAEGACAAWGGCLAGIADATDVLCLRNVSSQKSAELFIDLRQDAAAGTPAEGWGATCPNQQPGTIPWSPGEPDDGSEAGVETGKQSCAEILPSGTLADCSCAGKHSYVCARAR